MMRTAYNRREGEVLQDKIWRRDRRAHGRTVLRHLRRRVDERALREIDRLSPGRIETREYSVRGRGTPATALIATGCG